MLHKQQIIYIFILTKIHLYFPLLEFSKIFPRSYCGIKKYTYLCTRK